MRSMTGFGAAAVEKGGLSLRAEVRAVNHRYLQLKLRLPSELSFLEPEVERAVRQRVERGALSLSVAATAGAALRAPQVDAAAARAYKQKLERLARELDVPPLVDLALLAGLPGVIGAEVDEGQLQREERLLHQAVAGALDALDEMREREGAALARDLQRSAKSISGLVRRIEKRMPQVVRAHHAALKQRVSDLLDGRAGLSDADLARELALIADRLDVTEELTRLSSHIEQLGVLLAKTGAVGRQLDFLVQEFLREANTIGSKCSDAPVAHLVVELKTWIERLREQVQNIE
jgi:uncharacterized protein (TIGR00255 family)